MAQYPWCKAAMSLVLINFIPFINNFIVSHHPGWPASTKFITMLPELLFTVTKVIDTNWMSFHANQQCIWIFHLCWPAHPQERLFVCLPLTFLTLNSSPKITRFWCPVISKTAKLGFNSKLNGLIATIFVNRLKNCAKNGFWQCQYCFHSNKRWWWYHLLTCPCQLQDHPQSHPQCYEAIHSTNSDLQHQLHSNNTQF